MPSITRAGYASAFSGFSEFASIEASGTMAPRRQDPLLINSGNSAAVPSNNNTAANSWLDLLSEVREQKSSSRYAKRNIVLLGDHASGKSALVASLRHGGGVSVGPNAASSGGPSTQQHHNNEHANLILLGHNWFAFKDDVRDETLHVDVWSIDHPNTISVLFEYGITNHEEEFPNTMFCFVNSMSRPWMALERLHVWFSALQNAVAQLKLDPSVISSWERDRELDFLNFRELQQQQAADKPSGSTAAVPLNLAGISLGPRTLTVQSGLNLFVIMTKSDHSVTLEREHNWRDQHFDYLQLALRQWCLAHGASLIYTSARTGKNIGLLLNYISARLIYSYFTSQKRGMDGFGTAVPEQFSGDAGNASAARRAVPALQFAEAAHILEKDDVFVPLGWDSDRKIDVLLDSINLATGGGKQSNHSHKKPADNNVDADADDDDQMVDTNGVPNVEYFEHLLVPVQLRKSFQQQKESRANESGGGDSATPTPDKSQNQRFQDEEQQFLGEVRQLLEASSAAAPAANANATTDGARQHTDGMNGETMNAAENADMLNAMLEGGGTNRPMSAGNLITAMTPAKRVAAGSVNNSSSASVAALTPMGSVGTDKAVSMFFEECLRKKPTMASSDLTSNPALK